MGLFLTLANNLCLNVLNGLSSFRWHTLNLFNILSFVKHHQTTNTGCNTAQRNKQACSPGRTRISIVMPHESTEYALEECVVGIHPNYKVHFPPVCRWGT